MALTNDQLLQILPVPEGTEQTIVEASEINNMVCAEINVYADYNKVMIYCNEMFGSASYTFPTAFEKDSSYKLTGISPDSIKIDLNLESVSINGNNLNGYVTIEGSKTPVVVEDVVEDLAPVVAED